MNQDNHSKSTSPRPRDVVGRIVAGFALPLLLISGIVLHLFTVYYAFALAPHGGFRVGVAVATFLFPLFSEAAICYFAWRASGSMINSYSVWVFAWFMLLVGTLALVRFGSRTR